MTFAIPALVRGTAEPGSARRVCTAPSHFRTASDRHLFTSNLVQESHRDVN